MVAQCSVKKNTVGTGLVHTAIQGHDKEKDKRPYLPEASPMPPTLLGFHSMLCRTARLKGLAARPGGGDMEPALLCAGRDGSPWSLACNEDRTRGKGALCCFSAISVQSWREMRTIIGAVQVDSAWRSVKNGFVSCHRSTSSFSSRLSTHAMSSNSKARRSRTRWNKQTRLHRLSKQQHQKQHQDMRKTPTTNDTGDTKHTTMVDNKTNNNIKRT